MFRLYSYAGSKRARFEDSATTNWKVAVFGEICLVDSNRYRISSPCVRQKCDVFDILKYFAEYSEIMQSMLEFLFINPPLHGDIRAHVCERMRRSKRSCILRSESPPLYVGVCTEGQEKLPEKIASFSF